MPTCKPLGRQEEIPRSARYQKSVSSRPTRSGEPGPRTVKKFRKHCFWVPAFGGMTREKTSVSCRSSREHGALAVHRFRATRRTSQLRYQLSDSIHQARGDQLIAPSAPARGCDRRFVSADMRSSPSAISSRLFLGTDFVGAAFVAPRHPVALRCAQTHPRIRILLQRHCAPEERVERLVGGGVVGAGAFVQLHLHGEPAAILLLVGFVASEHGRGGEGAGDGEQYPVHLFLGAARRCS